MSNQALDDRRAGVDVVLTRLSIGIPIEQEFIGDALLPIVPNKLSRAKFPVFGTEAYRIREDKVGDYSRPEKLDVSMSTTDFEIDGHALEGQVSDREQGESVNGPLQVDLDFEVLQTVKANMALSREKLQADLLRATASYGSNHADLNGLGTRFDDSSVDPIDTLTDLIETTIPDGSGKRPNTFWMGQQVWAGLIKNTKLKNRIFGSTNSQPIPTTAQIASLIGVSNVLIGRALSKTSADVNTKLWGKDAGLIYVPPTAGKRLPAFGYTIEQTVFENASEKITRIRDEHMGASGGWIIKRSSFYTPTVLFGASGYLLQNAVA